MSIIKSEITRREYVTEEKIITYRLFGIVINRSILEINLNNPDEEIRNVITLFRFKPNSKLGKFLLRKFNQID